MRRHGRAPRCPAWRLAGRRTTPALPQALQWVGPAWCRRWCQATGAERLRQPAGVAVTALERLRRAAELLPPGTGVTLSREALLDALGTPDVASPPAAPGDLTVAQLADHFQRSPSTIRDWCEHGRLGGAYKLNDRDWRVPMASVAAFVAQQRTSRHGAAASAGLGAWQR